jgi:hypothetical protein
MASGIACYRRAVETDLPEVDVGGSAAGPEQTRVHLESDR